MAMRLDLSKLWKPAAAVASGILVALSFPPVEASELAWMGLIPLLVTLVLSGPREGFRLGFLSGAVFWLMSLSWLLSLFDTSPAPAAIILAGWILLCGYCALFTGAFGMSLAWVVSRIGIATVSRKLALTVVIPLLWTGFEYLRSVLLGGFPWNLIGVSQFRNIFLIQSAEWVGVYGISALILIFNAGVALTVLRYLHGRVPGGYRPHIELFAGIILVAVMFRLGMVVVADWRPTFGSFIVTAVQPGIPQVKKWDDRMADQVHATLRRLTTEAATNSPPPDLVVWPETATPGLVTAECASQDLVRDLCQLGVPLLVGAMDIIQDGDDIRCYNSSFLFDQAGRIAARYDKQHLVPFGEYIPLSGLIPVLGRLAPMGWNCTAGRVPTVFRVGSPATAFSSLICFEDVMPWLSRRFVRSGARLLINQTNDAWFDRSGGPAQHMAHCVFRAVENRVPVLRVANSGITCMIEPSGVIEDPTENSRREAPASLSRTWPVAAEREDKSLTFYTRHGDIFFALPCGLLAGVCLILAVRDRKRSAAPLASAAEPGDEGA